MVPLKKKGREPFISLNLVNRRKREGHYGIQKKRSNMAKVSHKIKDLIFWLMIKTAF